MLYHVLYKSMWINCLQKWWPMTSDKADIVLEII